MSEETTEPELADDSKSSFSTFFESRDSAEDAANAPTTVGRYRIGHSLGGGGQGRVYHAFDPRLERVVALKILSEPNLGRDPQRVREAQVLARLSEPGICKILDVGTVDGHPWIATEFIEGWTLRDHLLASRAGGRRCLDLSVPVPFRGTPLAEERAPLERIQQVLLLIARIARSLHAAHEQGVVHKDVKPANVMMRPDGQPIIVDFGLAQSDDPALSLQSAVGGTPAYMSPEQAACVVGEEAGPRDARTDVYSLGVTLYECLTIERPYRSHSKVGLLDAVLKHDLIDPREFHPGLPRDVRTVLEVALERDLDRRYLSCREFAEDLERVARGEPPRARPISFFGRGIRWAKRSPVVASLSAAVALLAVMIPLILWRQEAREGRILSASRDVLLTERLVRDRDGLYPLTPKMVAAMDQWLAESDAVRARIAQHEDEDFSGVAAEGRQRYQEGLAKLSLLRQEVIGDRKIASQLEKVTLADPAALWAEVSADFQREHQRAVAPQLGLVPRGKNTKTGLWEFWCPLTGRIPVVAPGVPYVPAEGDAVLLVLLPGGKTTLGRPSAAEEGRVGYEVPTEVTLAPFFMGAHEVSQDLWWRLMSSAPSQYCAFRDDSDVIVTPCHPVENITWFEAWNLAEKVGLRLPTEAQWEYAARGSVKRAVWCDASSSDDLAALEKLFGNHPVHRAHAPIGTLAANPFGLYDVLGNVSEWCAHGITGPLADIPEAMQRPALAPTDKAALRGGHWNLPASELHVAHRMWTQAQDRSPIIGMRLARPLDP